MTSSLSRRLVQPLQHVVGCVGLAQPGKNILNGMAVGVGAPIGHGIHDKHDVVAQIVGATRCRFHADTGRDAGNEDLSYAALTQVII
jgi:hypothetical protein